MREQGGYEACPDREPALERFLFGQMEGRERAELQQHLEACRGCRLALQEAGSGLEALDELEDAPLPFGDPSPLPEVQTEAERAWRTFVAGSIGRKSREHPVFRIRAVAAAALILVGIGIGYWGIPGNQGMVESLAATEGMEVDSEAVDALVRAEFLADLGLPYIDGVLQLVAAVMELDPGDVGAGNLESIRAQALDLLRDGRLLQRRLESERDRTFLATIHRAAFFLEEVSALSGGPGADGSLQELRQTLQLTGLGDRLVALDVDGAVSEALDASGWIGEEYAQSRETRR